MKPKDDEPPASAESLPERIRSWLEGQGYPLEMEAARTFRRAGFDANAGWRYLDAMTSELREIDLFAWRNVSVAEVVYQLAILGECKLAKQPWLIFTGPPGREPRGYHYESLIANGIGRRVLRMLQRRNLGPEVSALGSGDSVGYALVQALSSSSVDVPYRALSSIASAVASHVKKLHEGIPPSDPFGEIVLPAIIIDAPLFECTLPEESDVPMLTELKRGLVSFPAPGLNYATVLVSVVTRPALEEFASDAARLVDYLASDGQDILSTVARQWRSNQSAE